MSWKMISKEHFTMEKGGYVVDLKPFGNFYPYWEIYKDGVMIDAAPHHRPIVTRTNKEIAGKAVCEKRVNELLKQQANE